MALWLLPLNQVNRLIRKFERSGFRVPPEMPVAGLEWAVRAASRRIPMATCLTQALALQFLLARAGHPSEIHIGVRKGDEKGFESHAWVECEGHTLLSAPADVASYSRVLAIEARPN